MTTLRPSKRPQLTATKARAVYDRVIRENPHSDAAKIRQACPVSLLAARGYFRNTLGRLGVNDFGVYDDAIFLITPASVTNFNANVDPVKTGWNPGVGKNFAQLMPGVWPFRQGPHRGKVVIPGALRQLKFAEARARNLDAFFSDDRAAGAFTVRRVEDDNVGDLETGYFAINVHPGKTGVSSWGCQTIVPDQWAEFSQKVYAAMDTYSQTWIPYALIEEKIA